MIFSSKTTHVHVGICFYTYAVDQEEIESLYHRFRTLDRGRKGYLSGEELLSIPELSINPLSQRLAYLCDGMNFKDFVRMISPYSRNATKEDRIKHLFNVWDVNGDGLICREDVEMMMRQAGGSQLSNDEVNRVVDKVMDACGAGEEGLDVAAFFEAMQNTPISLSVQVPTE